MLDCAKLYSDFGKFSLAIKLYQECYDVMMNSLNLGPCHRDTLTIANLLVDAHFKGGNLTGALQLCLSCLKRCEGKLPKNHTIAFECRMNLGKIYAREGAYDSAKKHYSKCLEIAVTKFGDDAAQTVEIRASLRTTEQALRLSDGGFI
jgi:tetratricopeptide (TPR) repeat protein